MTTIRKSPDLAKCSEASLLGSLLIASQLGLEPNTPLGECYLIKYDNECTFQLGYKGILNLAYRSGLYKRIFAEHVYPSDIFKATAGLDPILEHERVFPEQGNPDKYYAVYQTLDGGQHFVVWGKSRIVEHAKKYSQSYHKAGGAWQKSFDAMAKKTVLIDLLRYAPKSIELQQAINADSATVNAHIENDEIVFETTYAEEPEKQALDNLAATVESQPIS